MRMRAKFVSLATSPAKNVAERWRNQYCHNGKWLDRTSSCIPEEVYNELCRLGPNPDIAAVAKLIGNKSWSYLSCSSCGEDIERGIILGDYCYETHTYCETCIREANQFLDDLEQEKGV